MDHACIIRLAPQSCEHLSINTPRALAGPQHNKIIDLIQNALVLISEIHDTVKHTVHYSCQPTFPTPGYEHRNRVW